MLPCNSLSNRGIEETPIHAASQVTGIPYHYSTGTSWNSTLSMQTHTTWHHHLPQEVVFKNQLNPFNYRIRQKTLSFLWRRKKVGIWTAESTFLTCLCPRDNKHLGSNQWHWMIPMRPKKGCGLPVELKFISLVRTLCPMGYVFCSRVFCC